MQKQGGGGRKEVVKAEKLPRVKALQARLGLREGQVPLVGAAAAQEEAVLPQPAHQINCG